MYYEFVDKALKGKKEIDLLYKGETYIIRPDNNQISLHNCRTNERITFDNFDKLLTTTILQEALLSEDKNNIWVGLAENRSLAIVEEFAEQVSLGGEIEFIFQGIGYFIGHSEMHGNQMCYVYDAYTHHHQYFPSSDDLLKNAVLGCKNLLSCIDKIQIISYC